MVLKKRRFKALPFLLNIWSDQNYPLARKPKLYVATFEQIVSLIWPFAAVLRELQETSINKHESLLN